MTPAQVVHKILGVRKLARDLNRTPGTVMKWAEGEGLVPAKYHRKIIELSEGRLTPHDLIYGRSD